MSKLTAGIDINNHVVYDINYSEKGYHASVTAGTSITLAVPVGITKAYITNTPGTTLLSSPNAITAPTSSFVATTCHLNAAVRDVRGVSTLYFYAIDDMVLNVSFYTE